MSSRCLYRRLIPTAHNKWDFLNNKSIFVCAPNYNPDSRIHERISIYFYCFANTFLCMCPFSSLVLAIKYNRQPRGEKWGITKLSYLFRSLFCTSRWGNENEKWMGNKSLLVVPRKVHFCWRKASNQTPRFSEESWYESFSFSAKSIPKRKEGQEQKNNESLMCTNDLILKINSIKKLVRTSSNSGIRFRPAIT